MKGKLFLIFISITTLTLAQECEETVIKVNQLIEGTLTLPQGNTFTDPLAIIIPGSGPTDRDGNQPAMNNNSLKLLAQGLCKQGVSTFRYDKRILVLLRKSGFDESKINFDQFIDDAHDIAVYMAKAGYTNISYVGHSQGALVAQLASLQDTIVNKMVLLEGAGRPIDQVVVDQINNTAPGLTENAKQAFEDIKTLGKSENYNPYLASIFRASVQPFMKSWMQYDPSELMEKINIPTLVVTGSKDLQVTKTEGDSLAAKNTLAQRLHIENMNHVLKEIKGDDLENSKSYAEGYRPVIPELINAIATFLKE
ncbi:MAG: alpha/beta hydrolase [Cytophagaceae bacterium]|nr:alpha/beta hydrolase [Cytophagaceae bacterium]|tara:strand:- start:23 stop:952 length:930 start_codon:yes stop_codon:yes gene_type:complete